MQFDNLTDRQKHGQTNQILRQQRKFSVKSLIQLLIVSCMYLKTVKHT